MADVLLIAVVIGFFAVASLAVSMCERIVGVPDAGDRLSELDASADTTMPVDTTVAEVGADASR